jgi:hypothetical protein
MTIEKISIHELYEIGIKKKYLISILFILFILFYCVHISLQEQNFQQKITLPLSSNTDEELINGISRSGNKLNPNEFYISDQGNNLHHKYSVRYFRNYVNEGSELVFIIESEDLNELGILINIYLANLKDIFKLNTNNKQCTIINFDNLLSSIVKKEINFTKLLFLDVLISFFVIALIFLTQILLNRENNNKSNKNNAS